MKKSSTANLTYIFYIFSFLILGLLVFFLPNVTMDLFHLIVSLSIIIIGFIITAFNILRRKGIQNILRSVFLIIAGYFFLMDKFRLLAIFPILLSLYLLLIGIVKLSTVVVYKQEKYKGFVRLFISAILDFIFSFIIINNPVDSLSVLTYVLGIYFIIISIHYIGEFFYEYHTRGNKGRKFRWTIPTIISLFIPFSVSERINKNLNEKNQSYNKKNTNENIDLEILVAVKDSNIGKFGHTDLVYNGRVYSYGSYDENSKRFFDTVGDGVLFTLDNRDKYLKFCTEHSNKTFFAFGISLTDKQKEKVEKELERIMSETYRWKGPAEVDKSTHYEDYGSELYYATKAKFYKFNQNSDYRLYYAMWTNCVKLIDQILGVTGSELLRLNGVITPGTYYYFLDEKFKNQNSNVIRKQIITNGSIFTQEKK
ncbi:MAG: DUF308 domain-containing protein [Bacilli bacterium]|nr:DUF308 domain-containing protein [Bacilli bacterium]